MPASRQHRLDVLAADQRRTWVHAIVWEVVTVVLMLTALIGTTAGWEGMTAVAGSSIAAATLALYRKG